MKYFHVLGLLLIGALAACDPANVVNDGSPPKFRLVSQSNDLQARFDLRLISEDTRPLCLTVEQWPNGRGQIESGGARAMVRMKDKEMPAKDSNFGYCPNGCGEFRVTPGHDLIGFVGYTEFADEAFISSVTDKTLIFNVMPYVCR
jgi:hypothetical protein